MELLGRFMAKVLYGWDNQKFEKEYLNKLEKNWLRWKGDRKIDENKHLKRIEERMEEENEKIRGRDWRAGYFSRGEILRGGNVKMVDGRLYFIISFHFILFFYF